MPWVEKNRKINNRGGGGDDYSGLESNIKSHKKPGFHRLFIRYIFRPAVLRLNAIRAQTLTILFILTLEKLVW